MTIKAISVSTSSFTDLLNTTHCLYRVFQGEKKKVTLLSF